MKNRKDGRNKSWSEFTVWCRRRRLKYLPAHPWTIAAYLRWCEPRKQFSAIEDAYKAIARTHLLKRGGRPHRHQTVKRTLRMIEQRSMHRGLHADLFRDEDFTAVGPAVGPAVGDKDTAIEKEEVKPKARYGLSMRAHPPLVSRRPARR